MCGNHEHLRSDCEADFPEGEQENREGDMRLKKLFQSFKDCDYMKPFNTFKWKVTFHIDDNYYCFFFLPTVTYIPWTYRYPGVCVWEICWLNIHICIGEYHNNF